jgi:hypothetical protein
MKPIVILYLTAAFIFFSSCATKSLKSQLGLSFSPSILAGCIIYGEDFKVQKVLGRGHICLPQKDGSWIVVYHTHVQKMNADGRPLWRVDGYFHHQALVDAQNNILLLGSENKTYKKQLVRFDLIIKMSQQGEELARYSFNNHFKDVNNHSNSLIQKDLVVLPQEVQNFLSVKKEATHVNSIQEVKSGYLINDLWLGACLLIDRDLKKIMKSYKIAQTSYQQSGEINVHDCQLLENDKLLYFSNINTINGKKTFSVYEQQGAEATHIYPKEPELFLETKVCGGAQRIGRGYLVTAVDTDYNATFDVVDSAGKNLKRVKVYYHHQDAKVVDLTEFFRNTTAN